MAQSRTLQSVKLSKDTLVSLENFLKTPIEYDVDHFKMQKSDTSKLICAVRNFYRHQDSLNEIAQGTSPSSENKNVRMRREIQSKLHKFPFQIDREVRKDLWKVKFLQRSKTSEKIRYGQLEQERFQLS